jgi:hypothetical protein
MSADPGASSRMDAETPEHPCNPLRGLRIGVIVGAHRGRHRPGTAALTSRLCSSVTIRSGVLGSGPGSLHPIPARS